MQTLYRTLWRAQGRALLYNPEMGPMTPARPFTLQEPMPTTCRDLHSDQKQSQMSCVTGHISRAASIQSS